jgi:hypothetical protein
MDRISSSSKRKSGSSPRRKSGSSPRRKSSRSPKRKSSRSPRGKRDYLTNLLSMNGPNPLSYLSIPDLINLSQVNEEIKNKTYHYHSYPSKSTTWNLNNKNIGDKEIIEIANSPYLKKIRKLNLSENNIGPKGAIAIANSPYSENLTELNLSKNHIGPDGCRAIARSKNLVLQLEKLILSDNNIGPTALQSFCPGRSTEFSNFLISEGIYYTPLRYLDLSINNIGDNGLKPFTNPTTHVILRLNHLNLKRNNIGDEGAIAIIRSDISRGLQELNLSFNKIGDKGGRAFANMQNTGSLKELNLFANNIGLETVIKLIKSPALSSSSEFEILNVVANNFDQENEETAEAIEEAISKSSIKYIEWVEE